MKQESDERSIDSAVAELTGEAAGQIALHPDEHLAKNAREPWELLPEPAALSPTYYDRPVLKEPVWIWAVPLYFYFGGLSGAAMVLGAAASVVGDRELEPFVRRCRWIGGIGGGIGSVLLIYDLGRPSRFLNMMRVFRPTSPMSVGAWVLAIAAPASMGSAIWAHQPGIRGALAEIGGIASGLLGMPLAGYTAVLLANSAVPVWLGARRTIPWLFVASAITAAASALDLMTLQPRERSIVRVFGTAGRLGELAATVALEREPGLERVRKPLRSGGAGTVLKIGAGLTAASLVTSFLPGGRPMRVLSGLLGTAAAIAVRFGVYHAGRASANDPRATFEQQRAETIRA